MMFEVPVYELTPEAVKTKLLAKLAGAGPPARFFVKPKLLFEARVLSSVTLEPNWVNVVLFVPNHWRAKAQQ